MDDSSGYIESIKAEQISAEFTDVSIVHTSEYNVLAKAKRYGRWYMLKGLCADASGKAELRQMLRKEFEILMQMQHPCVVQTVGLETVGELGTCIVMEYIDGTTLKDWLTGEGAAATGGKREREAMRIAAELLDAVDYIHSLGIAHRDLKPSNVMLTRQGCRVKLIDFGLADTDDFAMLKQQAGTARYMAPEQAAAGRADVRNDIYSLGVLMSEMPLPSYYEQVWSRCMLPVDKRYQSIGEMQADIVRRQAHGGRLLRVGVAAVAAAVLAVVGLLIWRVQALDNELNRVANAKTEAIEALHGEMERSRLDEHTDTLTSWEYRWPDLTQRVMAVNQFCYDYADRLDERLTTDERDRIRDAMLAEWQQWQQHIYTLSTATVATKRREMRRKQIEGE